MVTTLATYPAAPPITPLRGTLIDAATVTEGMEWLDGEGLYDSYNCMSFGHSADFCTPTTKTFDNSPAWQNGIKFAVYGGVECNHIGLDGDIQSKVEAAFTAGESVAVERALLTTRFRADTQTPARWSAAPVDLTPTTGAVKPLVGVSILEGYAANNYVGAPTLHIPRTIASLLIGAQGAILDPSGFTTKLGSKIAAGAGYDFPNTGPDGTEPAAGEKWLYATGEVSLLRGETMVRQITATGDPATAGQVYVLAERGYIAAVDCFVAAVRVSVS